MQYAALVYAIIQADCLARPLVCCPDPAAGAHHYSTLCGSVSQLSFSPGNANVTSVVSVVKMGNIAPSVGIEPKSLTFQASSLTITPLKLAGVTTLPTHTAIPVPCLCLHTVILIVQ